MGDWPKTEEIGPTTFGGLSRSQLMSRVKSRGNKTTEVRLAGLLEKAGVTGWSRHEPLPGTPDFAWLELKVAVFVNGCFWHGHNCGKRNIKPKSNSVAWEIKIKGNRRRDNRVDRQLRSDGWTVIRIWECQLVSNSDNVIRRIKRQFNKKQKSN
ncbi:MAG: very short patch repair endonuclease [Deltaproteobacteria bacterium]|nr:very short patch repair endonuclease [Deltaproteobacteria bacterium]